MSFELQIEIVTIADTKMLVQSIWKIIEILKFIYFISIHESGIFYRCTF